MNKTLELSETEYHAHHAVGSTQLKTVLKSLGHYKYSLSQKRAPTKAMNFGTCFHLAVLEPKRFKNEVVAMPEFKGAGMYAKKDAWLTENHGKLVLSQEEMTDCQMMLRAVSKHNVASSLLVGGVPELSYFWTDRDTQIECKARPDYRRHGGALVDIKTTEDASLEEFSRSVLRYGYHLSAAHYLNGVSAVLGQQFDKFIIIAVEKSAPYGIHCFEVDFGTLEKGEELCKRALLKLKTAKETNSFPNYPEEITPLNIPTYGFSA